MNSHLVTIEVSVVSTAGKWVQTNRRSLNQNGLKGLNRKTVESRRTVEHHRVSFGHLGKDIPNFGGLTIDHLLGRTNSVAIAEFFQTTNNEGLEESQRHLLGKTALVQLELGSDHDDRTSGVIDPLTEKVLTETSAFTFEHVGKGLERPVSSSGDSATMTTVVKESIDSLLKHALLVADDDLGGLQLHEVAQSVVPVDDTTVKVVQVGGRKATPFQGNKRTKIWRNDRQYRHDHPLGA